MAQKIATLAGGKRKELETLIAAFESARDSLYDAFQGLADEWRAEWDDRSERWQEGEAGQEAAERIQAMQALADESPDPDLSLDAFA